MQRFFKTVATGQGEDGFRILLDGRPVKTPSRNTLVVPSDSLAAAIAEEWDAQAVKIEPKNMPLSQLSITAIDRIAPQREIIISELARYALTDLTCYFAEGPDSLCARQAAVWDKPRERFGSEIGLDLRPTSGVIAIEQPPQTITSCIARLNALPLFRLTVVQAVTALSGSLVLGFALEREWLTADGLFDAAFVDELYQLELWGDDEEARARLDILKAEIKAAERFLSLL